MVLVGVFDVMCGDIMVCRYNTYCTVVYLLYHILCHILGSEVV